MTLLVSEESAGERLDKFLAAELAERFSRERLQELIEAGAVTVDGQVRTKPSHRLREGEEITVAVPADRPLILEAENIPLEIVFEDESLLVVNKPAGMLTHPTGREITGTLVNALLHHCRGSLSGINGVIRPGIVHRLDRDTTGLLMVAKTDEAHRGLSAQIQAKTARREYRAIVQGVFKEPSGTVSAPIDRNPRNRDKMAVLEGGRPAVTHWEVLETLGNKFSLMHLRLETGRTHQIRVHMAHLGHPVLGDLLYGSGIENILKLKTQGQLLQAIALRFTHPKTGDPLAFELTPDPEIVRVWTWLAEREGSA